MSKYVENNKIDLSNDDKEKLRLYIYATVAETGNFTPRDEPPNRTNTLSIPQEYLSWGDTLQVNYNKYSFKNGITRNQTLKITTVEVMYS